MSNIICTFALVKPINVLNNMEKKFKLTNELLLVQFVERVKLLTEKERGNDKPSDIFFKLLKVYNAYCTSENNGFEIIYNLNDKIDIFKVFKKIPSSFRTMLSLSSRSDADFAMVSQVSFTILNGGAVLSIIEKKLEEICACVLRYPSANQPYAELYAKIMNDEDMPIEDDFKANTSSRVTIHGSLANGL